MILGVKALPIGNAIQLFIAPPAGAVSWRVLRSEVGPVSGPDDQASTLVADESAEQVIMDDKQVVNGVTYNYGIYYSDGSAWLAESDAFEASAASTYTDDSVDVLSILRDRLIAGLKVEVMRGALSPKSGAIQVLTAPPTFENTPWPVVTVHLDDDSSADRSAGEMKFPDVKSPDGVFIEGEGWLSQVQVSIVGWSLNADEREALRKSIRRIIVGNLAVFDSHGMVTPNFSQRNIEDFNSYNAPVYQTVGSFSCKAPVIVSDAVGGIADVEVAAQAFF